MQKNTTVYWIKLLSQDEIVAVYDEKANEAAEAFLVEKPLKAILIPSTDGTLQFALVPWIFSNNDAQKKVPVNPNTIISMGLADDEVAAEYTRMTSSIVRV